MMNASPTVIFSLPTPRSLRYVCAVALLMGAVNITHAAEYFVDQSNAAASDANNGSASKPWKSLYAANNRTFAAGDVITVRDGIYKMSTGGNWDMPIVNLGSSGTQNSPITIRSENKYGAIIDGGGSAANPPLGSNGRNYLVIDGFEVRNVGAKGIAVFDATGVVIQNCKIHGVNWNTTPGDNTDAVRIERSTGTIIRNNDIYGVDSGVTNAWNGAGIKLYDTSNTLFENNYVHDYAGAAIFDKRAGLNNTYRFNRIENVYHVLVLNTLSGAPNGNIRFHNNVVKNVANLMQVDERVDGNVYVYSNTFLNYTEMGLRVRSTDTAHRAYSYNNIFVRSAGLASNMGDLVIVDPTMMSRSDYNVYPSSSQQFVLHQYESGEKTYLGLTAIRSAMSNLEAHSFAASAAFQNAGGNDYRLASGSSLKGTARVDGISSGNVIDPGAYSVGNEVIGISTASNVTPQPPQVRVE